MQFPCREQALQILKYQVYVQDALTKIGTHTEAKKAKPVGLQELLD